MMRKTRRSENKSDPVLTAKYYCKQKGDQGGFKKIYINENIGDGVFAIKDFKCGEFLLEYAGNLVSKVEGEKLMLVPSCFFIMTIALMLLIILSLGNMLMTVK